MTTADWLKIILCRKKLTCHEYFIPLVVFPGGGIHGPFSMGLLLRDRPEAALRRRLLVVLVGLALTSALGFNIKRDTCKVTLNKVVK